MKKKAITMTALPVKTLLLGEYQNETNLHDTHIPNRCIGSTP